MHETLSTLKLDGSKISICYDCKNYEWYIGWNKTLDDARWVLVCKVDFPAGDDVQHCDGFSDNIEV